LLRIAPLNFNDLDAELKPNMDASKDMMGFMPNDGLIMARKLPGLKVVHTLLQAIYLPGLVSVELKN
jgi:hypothetical protein|tara:strand:+ start:840 stop:1040 length:201 start_codon:yes stop_codon:yes gene_type:complete